MKFTNQFVVIALLVVKVSEAVHNCSVQNLNYYGFGCDLNNLNPQNENQEIALMADGGVNKTGDDIKWVQIRNSQFRDLPKGVFEKFKNMAQIFIRDSSGFQNFDISLFSAKLDSILMQKTDLELIGENAFSGLSLVKTLNLMNNNVSKVHKNAFVDLVNLEYISMSNNNIEYLDDDVFATNLKLETVLMARNKLIAISARLFSRNTNITSLDFTSNAISQIEKNFLANQSKLKKLHFTDNECVSDAIILTSKIRMAAFLNKLKTCNINYSIMKSSKNEIRALRDELDGLKVDIDDAVERVNNDMKILEGKLDNSTDLEAIKSDLVNFFKSDAEAIRKNFVNNLNNASEQIRIDLKQEIENEVSLRVAQNVEVKQEKLIQADVESIRGEFSSKISFIYFMFFAVICGGCVATFFYVRKFKLTPTMRYKNDDARLLVPEFD